jgi:hypothetical protein
MFQDVSGSAVNVMARPPWVARMDSEKRSIYVLCYSAMCFDMCYGNMFAVALESSAWIKMLGLVKLLRLTSSSHKIM